MADTKMKGVKVYNAEQRALLRKCVRDSLIELLKTKDFDSISVSDLCAKAGVSRTGFYANYKTKTDVFEEITSELIQGINREVGRLDNYSNSLEYYQKLFTYVEKSRDTYKVIMDSNFEGKYLEVVNSIVVNHEGLTEEEKVRRLLWTGAIVNITVRWVYKQGKTTADEMALWCYKFLEKIKTQNTKSELY